MLASLCNEQVMAEQYVAESVNSADYNRDTSPRSNVRIILICQLTDHYQTPFLTHYRPPQELQNTPIAHPIVTILEDPWAEPLSNDINLTQTIVHIHMSTATVTILIRRFILETSCLILGLNPPYMKHLQR